MKKNLSLLLILVSLLAVTYFVEERGSRQKVEQKQKQESLFNEELLGTLKSISFPDFDLVLKGDQYFVDGNFPIDDKKRDMILEQLTRLRLKSVVPVRDVEKIGRSFFIEEKNAWVKFTFEKGWAQVFLGKKLDFSKEFYMEVVDSLRNEEKIAIVEDSKPEEAVIDARGNERSDYKYRRLQSLIFLPKEFMYDQSLFSKIKFDFESLSKVTVNNVKKLSYVIIPKEKRLTPSIPSSFTFNEAQLSSFVENIQKMQGQKVYINVKDEEFSTHICTISLFKGEEKIEVDFYRMYKNTIGSFVKIKGSDYAIAVSEQNDNLFFTEYQDFIVKRFHESLDLNKKIVLEKNGKKAEAQKNNETKTKFSKLTDYLTRDASYFTPYLKEDMKQEGLSLHYGDESYLFYKNDHELVVLNKEKKLKLHYKIDGEVAPSLSIKDYLR